MLQPEMDVTLFIQFSNETFQWRLDEMIKFKKPGCEHIGLSFFVCVRSFNFGWSPVYDCKAYLETNTVKNCS